MTTTPPTQSRATSQRARVAQREAADPTVSAWVAANAGTGKTQVLTDRILRLLLAGTRPERIVALTYTKAAASEMAKRVFDRLAQWVMMPAEQLRQALSEVMGRAPTEAEIDLARQLFAAAIETPGGLKVQTIHAFAERLLQRFPLEAGVPPQFTILDDRTGADLLRTATDGVLGDAALRRDTRLGAALQTMIAFAVDEQFDTVLRAALANRDWLLGLARLTPDSDADADDPVATLYRRIVGVPLGHDMAALTTALARTLDAAALAAMRDVLGSGGKKAESVANSLARAAKAGGEAARIDALREAFLTGEGKPRKAIVTKALAEAHPQIEPSYQRAQDRFLELDRQRRGLELVTATCALATLASSVLDRYEHAKQLRAALDFDDLIRKARSLLLPAGGDEAAAAWVLFKLDGGIDHILVDEAQDTAPVQWSIIEALSAEFFSGGSRDDVLRTLFAVGDEKQSIYRFQGAAPEMLEGMGEKFADVATRAGRSFKRVPLDVSFRTTAPILSAVDTVFADPARTPGLTASGASIAHVVHRAGHAGLVEIWPLETPEDPTEADPWSPLAEKAVVSPVSRLAGRMADLIAGWLQNGERLSSENRLVRASDILVLVGRRRPFAPAMVAALKTRKVPVAGADRLLLGDQIAVRDLVVLADFLTLPEDDLALATVLKSPLFGLDDDALLAIAHGRRKSLWSQLLDASKGDPRFAEAADRLRKWRSEADFLPPYEFFASLLNSEHGLMRTRLLSRLGAEAADPIDELLNLALAYDEAEPPSLQGFLSWMRAADHEIKRDMEQGRDEVRVMTVHGSKGLEAPIVFLPDTCSLGRGATGPLLRVHGRDVPVGLDGGAHLWTVKGTREADVVTASLEAEAAAETAERNRLLYVALTRPRDRLYIAGFTHRKDAPLGSWYKTVKDALAPGMTRVVDADGRECLRLETAQAAPPETQKRHAGASLERHAVPEWALRRPPPEKVLAVPLAPSRLAPLETDETGEAVEPAAPRVREPVALPADVSSDTRRFLRGTLTHALLEHLPLLPQEGWDVAAKAFVERRGDVLPARTRAGIVREALAILRHSTFAPLFGPESQSEVPIAAELKRPDGRGKPLKIFGQIDRLARVGDRVLIVDYKTNRPPPTEESDVAEAYLLQLAAYRAAIRMIYPGCDVAAAIVWTDGARLMEISTARLDAAESRLWDAAEAA